jgi:hypothetical protein
MTPPMKTNVFSSPGPKSVQDQNQDGRLDLKDQVEVQDPRNPSGTKHISVDYFVSVEYRDPADRSPMKRLTDVIERAKAEGFGGKGKFSLDPEVVRFTLQHQVWWIRNRVEKQASSGGKS